MSKPQEKCIAQSSSCHTKYRRYSHQRPEISTTSSSSLARSCAQSFAMTNSSTRSIGLPENRVGSVSETEVIGHSSSGWTGRYPHPCPETSLYVLKPKLTTHKDRGKPIFGVIHLISARTMTSLGRWLDV